MDIVEALSELVHNHELEEWLREPNVSLDGKTPIHMIRNNDTKELWDIVHRLRYGVE
jgi:uncharacterized protein (DUF2384 family)